MVQTKGLNLVGTRGEFQIQNVSDDSTWSVDADKNNAHKHVFTHLKS